MTGLIEIDGTYYIDATDPNNFTLKERGQTKPRDGSAPKPTESIHGYFANVGQALGRYTNLRVHKKQPANLAECLAELKAINATIQAVKAAKE